MKDTDIWNKAIEHLLAIQTWAGGKNITDDEGVAIATQSVDTEVVIFETLSCMMAMIIGNHQHRLGKERSRNILEEYKNRVDNIADYYAERLGEIGATTK